VIESSLNRLLTWRRLLPVFREMVEETLEQSIPAAVRLTKLASKHDKEAEIFDDVREDYERVKRLLGELQNRVGRLSDHIDSELSIQNANQSLEENHSLARLSWLATIFIPATFIAGLFSMSNDLTAQLTTFKVYFSVALPTTALIMLFVWALNSKYWKDWRTKREKNKLEASAATEKSKLKSKG
jgi:Mg2+ and Co2+ transporter CorA